jgi:serine/threonine protein kinase
MVSGEKWLKKPGESIGAFMVLSPIGSGGMGQVFLCRDLTLNRNVAVKVVGKRVHRDPELHARFLQEGRLLAQVHHPNITAIYSLGEDDTCVYIAMEHVEGESLHSLIRECRINYREMVDIVRGAAMGLQAAHDRGIVHRDIKPANILVDRYGTAKIIDFGIAKVLYSEGDLQAEPGMLVGTINYMAPELIAGSPPNARTDLYSLGLVMAEMINGKTPFAAATQAEVLEKIRVHDLGLPRRLDVHLPGGFREAVLTATNVDPTKRYGKMIELVDALAVLDFSNLPPSFCRPLMREDLGDIDATVDKLEASKLARSDWPLVLSHALTQWNRSDEPQTTVTEQNIPAGLLNAAIAEVEYRREKLLSGVKTDRGFRRPDMGVRIQDHVESYSSAGPILFLLLIAFVSAAMFAWKSKNPFVLELGRQVVNVIAPIPPDRAQRMPSTQTAPSPAPRQPLPNSPAK